MRVLALCPDLLFRARIQETAKAAGAELAIVRDAGALVAGAQRQPPDLVIVDLSAGGDAAIGAVATLHASDPQLRVVGFYSHVQDELARRAREAGCGEVVARSRFVALLPSLLATPS